MYVKCHFAFNLDKSPANLNWIDAFSKITLKVYTFAYILMIYIIKSYK